MSLHPGEQGVCAKHGVYDEFCGRCSEGKMVYEDNNERGIQCMRDKIIAYGKVIKNSDSKKETALAIAERNATIEWLRTYCPHDLVVVMSSQGRDYEENCTVAARHRCIVCGLEENGINAQVSFPEYEWCPGTFKKLLKEPFARFEPACSWDGNNARGRWTMGDPLETPLQDLLKQINASGYGVACAAYQKRKAAESKDKEAEEMYQRFKAKHLDRLTREIVENYFKGN